MSTPQWFSEFERQEAMREERLDEIRARTNAAFNQDKAFELMREHQERVHQEMLRLDDHVPRPEVALANVTLRDSVFIGLLAAATWAVLIAIGAAVWLYGWRVIAGGG